MLIGVGLDIEAKDRFHRILKSRKGLLPQIFTERELAIHQGMNVPADGFAAAFAVKEAAFKALGSSWTESSLFWTDIELINIEEWGTCEIALSGAASELRKALGVVDFLASLHFTPTHVIAQVWLLGAESTHSPEERES